MGGGEQKALIRTKKNFRMYIDLFVLKTIELFQIHFFHLWSEGKKVFFVRIETQFCLRQWFWLEKSFFYNSKQIEVKKNTLDNIIYKSHHRCFINWRRLVQMKCFMDFNVFFLWLHLGKTFYWQNHRGQVEENLLFVWNGLLNH